MMRRRASVAKLWVTPHSKNHLPHCDTIKSHCHALCSGYNNVVCYSSLCKSKVQFMWNSFWKRPAAKCEVHVSAECNTWWKCFESLCWLHHVFCMWRENVVFCNNKVHICINLFFSAIWHGHLMIQNWRCHIYTVHTSLLSNSLPTNSPAVTSRTRCDQDCIDSSRNPCDKRDGGNCDMYPWWQGRGVWRA